MQNCMISAEQAASQLLKPNITTATAAQSTCADPAEIVVLWHSSWNTAQNLAFLKSRNVTLPTSKAVDAAVRKQCQAALKKFGDG